ncbi:MAG: CAP domain-containing protein [Frankiaceae bacterium]|nr:CAP domain-containing protein [Frankiaceae bacterium]
MLRAVRRATARVLVTTVLASIAGTVTAVVAPAVALASNSSMESQFIAKMNAAREANGLRPYSVSSDLTSIARQHSNEMASQGRLYHNPNLTSQVQNWQAVGENVGDGPTVDDIHSAFMHSPEHRANILDHDYTQVGVGVTVDSSGQVWVTEDFRQPMHSSSSSSSSAPATHHSSTHSTSSGTTTAHHYASTPTRQATTQQATSRPAAAPAPRAATPAATPAAVLKARLSKLRTAAAKAQSADPVSQAFDYLSNVTTLSG